jgi:serine protease AprX
LTPEQAEEQCTGLIADARTDWQTGQFVKLDPKSMWRIAANNTGARTYYNAGFFGQGVDVAVIDSGVSQVAGLDTGNVVNGPDLSTESQAKYAGNDITWKDTYGHGTHLAGIIAGRDMPVSELTATTWSKDMTRFMGIAPRSRVLNMKVADAGGATDVTQVIAAIDWVVKHAHDPGYNVRVINLSYGLNSLASANTDALSYAVQQAWNAGIVVVAAAGNEGKAGTLNDAGVAMDLGLTSPAFNRDVLAVASYGTLGASSFSTGASQDNMRFPDVAAWGESLPSFHVPGTTTDAMIFEQCMEDVSKGEAWTTPLIGAASRFVKGSGTSQAAAVASGAVALMLSQDPTLSPDEVKKLLSTSAAPVANGSRRTVGDGRIDLTAVFTNKVKNIKPDNTNMKWGSLDAARGDSILESPTKVVPLPQYWNTVDCNIPANAANPNLCTTSKLTGNTDWLGNPLNAEATMIREKVNPKKSPYCLDVNDYVTQKAFTNGKCPSPYNDNTPTAWTYGFDANYRQVERWMDGVAVIYSGKAMFLWGVPVNSAPLQPANSATKWAAPNWLGFAYADMDYSGLTWEQSTSPFVVSRWKVSRLKESDLSVSRLRHFDFVVSRWKTGDLCVSRLRGSRFTVSRLKDFGWKDFDWS